jgi:N6-L-threonylcarbamoyladenine synthase
MAQRNFRILAIETSCDETAAAVASYSSSTFQVLGSVVASQIKLHMATNGVVPEVAARAHIQKIRPVVRQALKKSDVPIDDIDAIAVTYGPGLSPSLLVGVEFAKGLAMALHKPLLPVNHMLGHLYSALAAQPRLPLPSMNLIVSGGHTYLVTLNGTDGKPTKYNVIGGTVDDAAGEAFDKIAKMLGLSYPGGPSVSKAALRGKKDYEFPRPMLYEKNYDFSFSGLKTAVLYKIANEKLDVRKPQVQADISLSFENAVIDVLVQKTIRAAKEHKAKSITLSGGVAANRQLRTALAQATDAIGLKLIVPDFELCTDNAIMIANAAVIMLRYGVKAADPITVSIRPDLDL